MASFNRVIVMGNLTKDPELKRNPSGTAVCTLRLAISESYRNKEGERIERPVYVDVVAWNQQAEFCNQYLAKGSPVLVEGRLQYDEWKTPENETRNKLRIVASRVQLIGGHGAPQPGAQADATPARPARAEEPAIADSPADDDAPPF
ncbi:MAG: single-stranded DNA-binding protein [Kiritimatiellae bacterium]|nr:single-stranded DNA-binding protein [Kiritimatiellia bacterium]